LIATFHLAWSGSWNEISGRSPRTALRPHPAQALAGSTETLPSGALRVRLYAGVGPLAGKRHDLIEVIPVGKDAGRLAEQARARLLTQLDEKRSPHTKATVRQVMERHLEMLQIEDAIHAPPPCHGFEAVAAPRSRSCSRPADRMTGSTRSPHQPGSRPGGSAGVTRTLDHGKPRQS
jgi:hypothetical protein